MRVVLVQTIALVLTLTAWGSDVMHVMHLGAAETLVEHEATTGNEEPDAPRTDGLGDEVAITVEALDLCMASITKRQTSDQFRGPAGDDHSLGLMRPPRTNAA